MSLACSTENPVIDWCMEKFSMELLSFQRFKDFFASRPDATGKTSNIHVKTWTPLGEKVYDVKDVLEHEDGEIVLFLERKKKSLECPKVVLKWYSTSPQWVENIEVQEMGSIEATHLHLGLPQGIQMELVADAEHGFVMRGSQVILGPFEGGVEIYW
jgi:hypothetical protein